MSTSTSTSSTGSTGLDLDALEREGRPDKPLVVNYRGETFTLLDPVLRPWEEYAAIDFNSADAPVRFILSEDDQQRFWALKPSTRALELLTEQVTAYYTGGLDQGESDGSPTS